MSNIIILRSVYGKVGQTYFMNPCPDPATGRYCEYVRNVDKFGDMILSEEDKVHNKPIYPRNHVFEIQDGSQFDLSNEWDKAAWECIKHSPLIATSRDAKDSKGNLVIDGSRGVGLGQYKARYGVAELYIENPGADTAHKINKKQLVHKAESFIFNDDRGAQGRLLKARLMGRDMKNAPDNDVIEFLLEVASKNPQKVIDVYTGTDTTIRLLFIDAKDRHVITIKNKVYMYNDIALGVSDDAVIAFLAEPKNQKLVGLITRDTYPEMESKKNKKTEEE